MNPAHISVAPRISEQTYQQAAGGVYVFDVAIDATKPEIKSAIESQYSVTVTSVNTSVMKGKQMPSARRRSQQRISGARRNFKKAYVQLAEGDKIAIFEEIE